MDSINEQDSLMVVIQPQPPAQPQQRVTREIVKDCEIKWTTQHNKMDIYFTCNRIYLQNLILRKQRANLSGHLKSVLGTNCIIYKQFTINPKQIKTFTGQQQEQAIKGNIHILFNPMMNIEFKVYFNNQIKRPQDYIWMNMHYCSSGVWKSKSFSLNQDAKKFSCKIPIDQVNDLIEPNMLVNLTLKRKQVSNSNHLGLINLGNTCFMNSCLQMLFYIRPLRKIILETKSRNPLIKALRQVFIMMMDVQQKIPVDVQELLSSYGKYNEQPRRQQDVQQFLLDFINEIQLQCHQVKGLWQGKSTQTTYSKQKQKYYKSTLTQEFAQLDVHLFDRQKRYYQRIEDSLKQLMQEEEVDELIDHDQYGKIKVAKYRRFQTLPDILFINLKRYEWNKEKMRLSKIFSHIQYGQNLNLGFVVGTPGGDQQINPECDYSLFSVLVHKGTSPQNGHYFVFVNTSNTSQRPQWVCFNDSLVTKSDVDQVLGFTGKKTTQLILDKNAGKFVEKEIQSDASSYLLVYIRKAVYDSYQGLKTSIPKDYIRQKIKKVAQKQKESLQDVNVLAFDNFDSNEQQFDLFNSQQQYMVIPLPKNQSLRSQLKRVSKSLFSIQAKYFYRVYVNERKLKYIQSYETALDVTRLRRGQQEATYILILSQKIPLIAQEVKKNERQGIIKISKNQMEDLNLPPIALITQRYLKILQQELENKGLKVNYIDSKEDFLEGWSKFIEVQILKQE